MRQHMRSTRLLAVLLGLSLVAAACGDDEDETEAGEDGQQGQQQEEQGGGGADVEDAAALLQEVGEADPSCEGDENGTLSIGGLLPETGDLAFMGPPMNGGATLAIEDINAAGGVNGQPVEFANEDSGDSEPSIAPDAVDRHLQNDVDVVLGAAASGISLNVIDTVTEACKIQFSPANTAIDFTIYDDDDLYFRTAPADIMQGQLQAELALEDGGGDAAVLARQDSYGQGLADYIERFYEEGGGQIVERRNYDPEATEFSAEVEAVLNADPDVLFMVGFEESYSILQDLFEQNFTPENKFIYFVDGNISDTAGDVITDPGALVGIRGTLPSAELGSEFRDRMHQQVPNLEDEIYGPETYDAVTVIALAAQEAGTDRPDEIARHINGITRDGTECTSFADCLELIEQGEDIDYNGVSGPLDFGQPGEPQRGTYAVQQYGQDNRIDDQATEFRDIELPES
jgi:ABC-type branched-subunit amino acid transport system substrate-binding protein